MTADPLASLGPSGPIGARPAHRMPPECRALPGRRVPSVRGTPPEPSRTGTVADTVAGTAGGTAVNA
ncbi:hypothetical protein [Streptosporangium sp. NPDC051022]|uniref:hypothetical protein n=1 Tax=Streptosporangium sp. NPDC051022 TaxID=3155752 RepID=UPI0034449621